MDECINCGFCNEFGYCECPSYDKWYACPIESKKPENVKELEEYVKWLCISRSVAATGIFDANEFQKNKKLEV